MADSLQTNQVAENELVVTLAYDNGVVTVTTDDDSVYGFPKTYVNSGKHEPEGFCETVADKVRQEVRRPVKWTMVVGKASDLPTKDVKNNTNDIGKLFEHVRTYTEEGEIPILGDEDCIEISIRSSELLRQFWAIPPRQIVFIDVETTGLEPSKDEVLQIAIYDGVGNKLLSSYVCPENRRMWPKAEEIHHITWDMVKDAPSLVDLSYSIEEIFESSSLIVGYNLRFDMEFLRHGRVNIKNWWRMWDIMPECSVIIGKWSDYHGNYSRVSLKNVASHYGIEYSAHDAAEDALTTSKVYLALVTDDAYKDRVAKLQNDDKESEEFARKYREQRNLEAIEREKKEKENKRSANRFTIGCLAAFIIVFALVFASCSSTCHSSRSSSRGYRSYTTSTK